MSLRINGRRNSTGHRECFVLNEVCVSVVFEILLKSHLMENPG